MKQPSRELSLKDLLKSGSFLTHFVSFFDQLPCASYFLIDLAENKLLHASSALLKITGFSLDYLKQQGNELFLSNVHPDDKPIVQQTLREQKEYFLTEGINGGSTIRKFGIRLFLQPGEQGHFEVFTSIFYLENNRQPIMVGMVKDVTEVHRKSEYLLGILSGYIKEGEMDTIRRKLTDIRHSSEEKQLKEISENFNRYKWLKEKLNQLSERELQVLRLIAEGLSSKELAERLSISSHTATSHRKNLMMKFNVRNTAELIKEASKVLSFN
ncbi:MAG: LuxR C-terminal-related transcriptional regulator [Cyclobacteriaceae bacterium]